MFYIIYQIRNKTNNKIYIGKHQTENKDDGYMGSGKYLRYAIEKEGIENFEKTILFECQSEEEMNRKEAEIVNEGFVNREDTYNIALGGDGGWVYNNKILKNNGIKQFYKNKSPNEILEIRQKACKKLHEKILLAIKEDPEYLSKKIKLAHQLHPTSYFGRHHTEETKQKMHEIHQRNHHQQGEKNSQYGKHWWKDPNDKTKSLPIKEGDPVPEGWIRGRWGKN